MNQKLQKS